jgi:hypothetical protein
MPDVTYERAQVVTSRLLGGKGREHIVVRNKSLYEFKVFISARDYGNFLDVSWTVTLDPGRLSRQLSKFAFGSGQVLMYARLDFFAQQDVAAFTTITLRAVTSTVQDLYKELNQDFANLNMKSRSGLAAW